MWVQLLIVVFLPPLGACLWRLMSRGWAMTVQGGRVSERTRRRQRIEFWVLLCVMYAGVAFIFVASRLGFRP